MIELVENGSMHWLWREYTCKETCGIQKDSAVDKGVLCVEKITDTTLQWMKMGNHVTDIAFHNSAI